MSEEAKTHLEEWLKVRKEYLRVSVKRANFEHYTKTADNPYIFPFSYSTALVIWNRLTCKAGFTEKEERTNRYKMHIHTLRKYYRTRMSLEIPVDVVEALMGHEGYLTQAYRRYSQEHLAELYEKAVHTVAVFDLPADTRDLEERLAEKDEEIYYLKKEMKEVRAEMEHRRKQEQEQRKQQNQEHWKRLEKIESNFEKVLEDKVQEYFKTKKPKVC